MPEDPDSPKDSFIRRVPCDYSTNRLLYDPLLLWNSTYRSYSTLIIESDLDDDMNSIPFFTTIIFAQFASLIWKTIHRTRIAGT